MTNYFDKAEKLMLSYVEDTVSNLFINEFLHDMETYKNHMIKQYNDNVEKATDLFCFKKFLNDYHIAINVFGLHKESKKYFNRYIETCWQEIVYEEKMKDYFHNDSKYSEVRINYYDEDTGELFIYARCKDDPNEEWTSIVYMDLIYDSITYYDKDAENDWRVQQCIEEFFDK